MTPALRAELERLLTGLLDDALGPAEQFRLNEILADDAECRRFYLEYVDLHVRLLHHPRLAALAETESRAEAERQAELKRRIEAERETVASASQSHSALPATTTVQPVTAASRSGSRWPSYVLTVAATLAASVALQFTWQRPVVPGGAGAANGVVENGAENGTGERSQSTATAQATANLPTSPTPGAVEPRSNEPAKGEPLKIVEASPATPSKIEPANTTPSPVKPLPEVATGVPADGLMPEAEIPATMDATKPLPAYVATLLQTVDCDWPDRPDLHEGMRLAPSALRLRKGSATIRFDGGAELKLTGPTMLSIVSLTSAVVHNGRVLFHSDDAAERFDLRTPHSQMLDYGTEYAVVVNAAGEELHVFEGEVVRKSPKDPKAKSLSVAAGEARKFAAAGDLVGSIVPLNDEPLKSVPRRPTDVGRDADTTLLAYEPFDYASDRLPAKEPGLHGVGWRDAWTMPPKGSSAEFRLGPGFKRGFDPTGMSGGSLSSSRKARIVRSFEEPLRTDRDGAFYFSLLARCIERKGPDGRPCDVQLSLVRTAEDDPQQNLTIGMSWTSGTVSVCWLGGGANLSLPLETQKVYLLTGKVVTSAKQPDQVFLRLFGQKQPVPVDEPARWTLASRSVVTDAAFDAVQLQTVTSSPLSADELRFGSTWSAVAAPYFTTSIREAAARE